MRPKLSQERIGELMILTEVFFYALFPIIITQTTKLMPPIMFAALSTILAAIFFFFYILVSGDLKKFWSTKAFKYILGVTLFIMIIPKILIFIGTSKSSGINTALLLQSQIVFTFIIVSVLGIEKITTQKIIGALLGIIGTIAILYNQGFGMNPYELMIVAGSFFFPIGNLYAKKALEITSPITILFVRSLLGGIALIVISFLFEQQTQTITGYFGLNLAALLINGIAIYAISKMFWYGGLKRIDLTKIMIITTLNPAVSLIYAYFLLGEIPNLQQWIGFIITISAIYTILEKSPKTEKLVAQ